MNLAFEDFKLKGQILAVYVEKNCVRLVVNRKESVLNLEVLDLESTRPPHPICDNAALLTE